MGKTNLAGSGGGLAQDLSNLTDPTAANESILPADNTQHLGNQTKPWEKVVAKEMVSQDTGSGFGTDLLLKSGVGPSGKGDINLDAKTLDLSNVAEILFAGKTLTSLSDLYAMELRINSAYSGLTVPFLSADGFFMVPFNSAIEKVFMYNIKGGTGGATELDIKYSTTSGGTFSTIFSTTPKIQASAGNNAYIYNGGSGTGLVAPVISVTTIPANSAIRMDLLAKQSGSPEGCGIVIFFRKV